MTSTVAVIEDDVDILHLVREILEIDGFRVETLASPDLARIAEKPCRPDVFLIDLMLPGMSGVELAEQLRRSGYDDTPMIAMSASRIMMDLAMASGLFQATIAKPFNLSTLLSVVEDWTAGEMANRFESAAS